LKFFACPISTVTRQSWDVLRLVNDCTDADCHLVNLPFPGAVLDQPEWFLEAVRIVRSERAEWQRQKAEESKRGR
jgi:hypothetical protein